VPATAALGSCFAHLIQAAFSRMDKRKHVAGLGKLGDAQAGGAKYREPRPAAITESHKPHLSWFASSSASGSEAAAWPAPRNSCSKSSQPKSLRGRPSSRL